MWKLRHRAWLIHATYCSSDNTLKQHVSSWPATESAPWKRILVSQMRAKWGQWQPQWDDCFLFFFSSLRRLEEYPVVYFLFCSLPWNNRAGMTLWASAWSDLQPSSINTDTHLSGRRLNFPRYPHANSGPEGFRELLNRCPGTQLCPSSIPSCFSSSINPLIPVQVSFNGRTGSLERDLKGLTLPRGGRGTVNLLH